MKRTGIVSVVIVALVAACSSGSSAPATPDGSGAGPDASPGDGGSATPPADSGGVGLFGDGAADDGSVACQPPDMLVVLDRTLTMHQTPDGQQPPNTQAGIESAKWTIALDAIQKLVAAPLDGSIRFGLELWPKEEPGCLTLPSLLAGGAASNPSCEGGEIVVEPALGTGATIASKLDVTKAKLCFSTPTGAALLDAKAELEAHKAAGRQQVVVLVTDGADWAASCPLPDPAGVVDQLAAAGISTVVVGFSAESKVLGGVGAGFLDDMACAGHTAKGFPGTCVAGAGGTYRATASDAGPSSNLFYSATNAAELQAALQGYAKSICCGCVK